MWTKLSQCMGILVVAYADNGSKERALALLVPFGCYTTYNVSACRQKWLAHTYSLLDLGLSYVRETNF